MEHANFCNKKKSGKWRLLQDLRAINATMEDMGALQPGLPSPVAVPQGYNVTVIDLQDCFFTIPLDPQDKNRFAFSLPSENFKTTSSEISMEGSSPGYEKQSHIVSKVCGRWPTRYQGETSGCLSSPLYG